MAILDIPDHPLAETLHLAFAVLIGAGDVDVNTLPDAEETEVQADDWTLHLEGWPLTTAWIAIDQEPVSPKEQLTALEGMLDQQDRAAMRGADRRLGGALLTCLRESGDDLSVMLAGLLERTASAQDEGDEPVE